MIYMILMKLMNHNHVSLNEWLKMILKSRKNDRSECKWTIIMFNWPGFGSALTKKSIPMPKPTINYFQACFKWSTNCWISQWSTCYYTKSTQFYAVFAEMVDLGENWIQKYTNNRWKNSWRRHVLFLFFENNRAFQ